MQDVVPKGDRSIRNIPVPPNRKGTTSVPGIRAMRRPPIEPPRKRRFHVSTLWILVGGVIAALLGLIVASFFEGAKVTVYPKNQAVTIDTELTASIDAPVGKLAFQAMRTERILSRTLPATGEARVERRASGIVTIFNEFGTQSQRLIKNTRFETPDGKIYRINDSITVPGGTRREGGTLVPGEIDVTVYADSPGEEYNKAPTDFTIPGFKGDPRYSKFRARSKTPLAGGFVGTERVVAEEEMTRAIEEMKKELGETLTAALASELPEGYLVVAGGSRFSFDEPSRENDSDSSVRLTLRGEVAAPIVRERDLASAVARLTVDAYDGEAILLRDPSAVALSFTGEAGDAGKDSIPVAVKGAPMLVWQFDAEALKADLAGKDKGIFETVIRSYEPEVLRATASLRPFFKSSFPEDPALIDVVIEIEE